MRTIKFRGYCKARKVWIYFTLSDLDLDLLSIPFDELDVIVQFTGFKDINGKEIYEGDILRKRWIIDGSDEEGFNYYFCELNGQRWLHKKGYTDWSDILGNEEVIGNIYENKELLEGEDV